MNVSRKPFGQLPDGKTADLFTLTNTAGMEVRLTNYGGLVVALSVPNRDGIPGDVVLGYDTLAEYLAFTPYFGALIGRFAGPIRNARYRMNGTDYRLTVNEGVHHLHGGAKGFDKVLWQAKEFGSSDEAGVRLTYLSPDGEEGYPGNLSVSVICTLNRRNELKFHYEATADRRTFVNLTHHGYFNLAGQGAETILNHEVMMNAEWFNPIDKDLVPTGEVAPVKGTPLDFTASVKIGNRIQSDHPQVRLAGGFDQNWLLKDVDGTLRPAARVYEPESGRIMEMETTEPGVQFYTSNILRDGLKGKSGSVYGKWGAFCLEAQRYPVWPGKKDFPPHILHPGERYTQTTLYRFITTD